MRGRYYSCSDGGDGEWVIVEHFCNENLAFDETQQKCTWEQDVPGCYGGVRKRDIQLLYFLNL